MKCFEHFKSDKQALNQACLQKTNGVYEKTTHFYDLKSQFIDLTHGSQFVNMWFAYSQY